MKYLVVFLLALLSFALPAKADQNICHTADIFRIDRPWYPGQSNSPIFSYAFEYTKGTNPNLPTIIFLQGGPGGTSIGSAGGRQFYLGLPLDYNVVFLDPRGRGCNENIGADVPASFFSTANLASDVLAVINYLGLDNYVLFGQSYGTLLASVVAARANKGEAPSSRAVVLQGTLGRAFDKRFPPYQGFQEQWDNLKATLPQKTLDQLLSSNLPMGFSADDWGQFIVASLLYGFGPDGKSYLASKLEPLSSGDEQGLTALKNSIQAVTRPASGSLSRIYIPILCQEISEIDNNDMALINGELIGPRNPDICAGFTLTHPYDSKNWELTQPTYYLQGENDPATYMTQAQYHFENQIHAPRFFVTVAKAGHTTLNNLFDCQDDIWKAVTQIPESLPEALRKCKSRNHLEIALPQGI